MQRLEPQPAAAYIGLGFLNTSPKHNFAQRLSAEVTAYAFMGIMVNGTKLLVDEKRPDSGAMNSFPSGHTATAFMGAELVRLENPQRTNGILDASFVQ